jgi:outer membrane PBP1 activator LpoA protein
MHRLASLFVFLLSLWSGGLFAAEKIPAQPQPHIALLLPLQSHVFKRAADAFRQGFMTAATFQPGLPIVLYPTGDQAADILKAYRQSVQAGAALVVGPLTRNAVAALLAEPLPVPTLALNTPEQNSALPQNLYIFSINVESEARQVARLAFADGHRSAIAISADTPLAKRAQGAFSDEWLKLGGTIAERLNFTPNQGSYPKLRAAIAKIRPDMLFLAAGAEKARAIRPYLDYAIPTYAISQIYVDNGEARRNVDLNQIRFIEMPWFLLPEHPAVIAYPRPASPLGVEQERFYALGIDAFRIVVQLLAPVPDSWPLDGVTGKIDLDGQQFTRELTAAQFRQDEAVATHDAP